MWQWVKTAVSALVPEAQVYRPEQGKPRSVLPLVTIKIVTDVTTSVVESWGDTMVSADEVDTYLTEHHTGTVEIQAYGSNFYDILNAVARSIHNGRIRELNTDNKLWITRQITPIQDITAVLGTRYEGRGSITFVFAYGCVTEQAEGLRVRPIDTINITGTVDTLEFNIQEEL